MADMDNFSGINENFDIIKTLLNSIKAQGILNTSDVDRLLSSINTKLEKINTEEDIDMIKIFLSELKQGLEERHGFLISKFASIESVFSELLKNSAGMMKTSELKELFDIVATNLSVFSREVVAQKETLTDISLRIDSLRTDDSAEKNIIKNIAILKPDIERLNNGFNSIVLSLNDNFKTVVKSIAAMDKTEHLDKFANTLSGIEMSSNTVLSALQMLDKKTSQVEEALTNLVTKSDMDSTNHKIFDLSVQNQEVSNSILNLLEKYSKIDNLAEKIDASVNVIAGLKAFLEEIDDKNTKGILEQIPDLQNNVRDIKINTEFSEFKANFEAVIKQVFENSNILQSSVNISQEEISKLISLIKALDVNVNFQNIQASVSGVDATVKSQVEDASNKLIAMQDANVSKILNDLASSKNLLEEKFKDSNLQLSLAFSEKLTNVCDNIENVKKVLTQLDDNTLSANNAIFANITDRLSVFENGLRESLLHHENSISGTSVQLLEQLESVKNLSGVLEYKMDSSRNDLDGIKESFNNLKQAIDTFVAQDVMSVLNEIKYNLKHSEENVSQNTEEVKQILSVNNNDIKQELQLSYSKLLEIQNLYNEVKDLIDVSETSSKNHFDGIIRSADSVKDNFNNKLEFLKTDLFDKLNEFKNEFTCSYADNIKEFKFTVENSGLKSAQEMSALVDDLKLLVKNIIEADSNSRNSAIDKFTLLLSDIKKSFDNTGLKQTEILSEKMEVLIQNADSLKSIITKTDNTIDEDMTRQLSIIESNFETLISQINILFEKLNVSSDTKLEQNFSMFTTKVQEELINNFEAYKSNISEGINELKTITNNRSDLITETILGSDSSMRALLKEETDKNLQKIEHFIQEIQKLLGENTTSCTANFEKLKEQLTNFFDELKTQNENIQNDLISKILEYSEKTNLNVSTLQQDVSTKTEELKSDIKYCENNVLAETDTLKKEIGLMNRKSDELQDLINNKSTDLLSQLDFLKNTSGKSIWDNTASIKQLITDKSTLISEISQNISEKNDNLIDIESQIKDTASEIKVSVIDSQQRIADIEKNISQGYEKAKDIENKVDNSATEIKTLIRESVETAENYENNLKEKIDEIINNDKNLENSLSEVKNFISDTKENLLNVDASLSEQSSNLMNTAVETENCVKDVLNKLNDIEIQTSEQYSATLSSDANIEQILDEISKQILLEKQTLETYQSFEKELLTSELTKLSVEITNSTNSISDRISHEFELLKNEQHDSVIELTSQIKDLFAEQIADYAEKMKAFIEINTNNADILNKFDLFKTEIFAYLDDNLANINKMLNYEVFTTTMSDYKAANEILIQSLADNINDKFETFAKNNFDNLQLSINDLNQNIDNRFDKLDEDIDLSALSEQLANISQEIGIEVENKLSNLNQEEFSAIFEKINDIKDNLNNFSQSDNTQIAEQITHVEEKIENRINIFDKNLIETIADKYEEIKLLSNKSGDVCENIRSDINDTLEKFLSIKDDCTSEIISLKNSIIDYNNSCENKIDELVDSFNDLRVQIGNISISENFDSRIKDEINGLQSLVNEQFNYVQDISDLCQANLPEITELNSYLKTSVIDAIKSFSLKLDEQDLSLTLEQNLKLLKTDLIKQFLNLFNQISFVTEQEEILDFVQEKHEELVAILSHIVTNTETLTNIDDKINTVKSDIQSLNKKISSIISAEDDFDYIYSLQDLESDITNLRIVLKEIQDENKNNKDIENLLNSTNNVYKLVESLKTELPGKDDFTSVAKAVDNVSTVVDNVTGEIISINKGIEDISEDILSISSRTNKLLLSSDESYKTLQDNLQGFRLVIDDLDERTRNFAKDSGMEKIDLKLNTINEVVQSGARSNQIFNQIFEYLAEWVDKAGTQINAISDKVETLDDIGQIKVLLADLKSEFLNNNEKEFLAETIDSIYEKQIKKISAIETKLDKLIVESTINNKQKDIDLSPIENTFNRFLVAIDEKMSLQQAKIEKLEKQLENSIASTESPDLTQFTKKIASMDRQLSKLNKNFEKITQNDK